MKNISGLCLADASKNDDYKNGRECQDNTIFNNVTCMGIVEACKTTEIKKGWIKPFITSFLCNKTEFTPDLTKEGNDFYNYFLYTEEGYLKNLEK